jgi:hypothetical protein
MVEYIESIFPKAESTIFEDQEFKVSFKNTIQFDKSSIVLALSYDTGQSILGVMKHSRVNGCDVFTIKSKTNLSEMRRVILTIKLDKMYSKETGSLLMRPGMSVGYYVEQKTKRPAESLLSSVQAFSTKRRKIGFDVVKSLANGTKSSPLAIPTKPSSSSSSSSSSSNGDFSILKKMGYVASSGGKPHDFNIDYESVETTIMTLLKLTTSERHAIRLVICFNLQKVDVITTIEVKKPFDLQKLKSTIVESPKVNLSFEPERLKAIYLAMGPPEWFYHIPVDDDTTASHLQNNDILKLDISEESNFEVSRVLSLEERLIIRFEEAKARGDVVDIEDNQGDEEIIDDDFDLEKNNSSLSIIKKENTS